MLPNKFELDGVVLPEIRRSILQIGKYHPDGEVYRPTSTDELAQDTRDALYSLLGLVHDLADEVQHLQSKVRYLESQ